MYTFYGEKERASAYELKDKVIYKRIEKVEKVCSKDGSKLIEPDNHRDQLCLRKIISLWHSTRALTHYWLYPYLIKFKDMEKRFKYTDWDESTKYLDENAEGRILLLGPTSKDSNLIPAKWSKYVSPFKYHHGVDYAKFYHYVACEKNISSNINVSAPN